ncbi:unnamed protein product, partial [marine sediment metagenome]
ASGIYKACQAPHSNSIWTTHNNIQPWREIIYFIKESVENDE